MMKEITLPFQKPEDVTFADFSGKKAIVAARMPNLPLAIIGDEFPPDVNPAEITTANVEYISAASLGIKGAENTQIPLLTPPTEGAEPDGEVKLSISIYPDSALK